RQAFPALFQNDVHQPVDQGDVCAGFLAEVQRGKVHQVNAARVNDDHLRAIFLHRFLHLQSDDGMVLARVRPRDDENVIHDDL
ncbi:MAG: hypothetical protein RL622_387, partial [Actinomycetota bacterium]